jgi:hypothetical protein
VSWQRGLPILPRTEWSNEKPPLKEYLQKFEDLKRRREEKDKQFFVLQDADGDFVAMVESDEASAVCGPHFIFTKDPDKARIFRYSELWRTGDLAAQFSQGFSGAKARRITPIL